MSPEHGARGRIARPAVAGLVLGFDNLSRAIALASLVFTGALAAGAPYATAVFLLSGILGTGSLMLGRYFVGPAFANVQNATVAILLPSIIALTAGPEAKVATVFAILGITAVLTGAAMVAVAALNLARFVQLVPFPVSSGYLAASGALLVISAVRMTCEGGTCLPAGGAGVPDALPALMLAAGFAAVLWVITLRWRTMGLGAALVLAFAGFYAVLAVTGVTPEGARAAGFLPTLPAATGTSPVRPGDVDPGAVLAALPAILAAAVVSLFSAMLNITGVELTLRRDMDQRRELVRQGTLNIVTGLWGSTVSFLNTSNTIAARFMGASGRVTGIVTCAVLALGILFAGDILAYVPGFVSSGLLIFFGASIVGQWWVFTRHEQTLAEWLLAFAIMAASVVVGMPGAVVLGIMAASLIFAVSYARLPVVRGSSDLSVLRSTVDRGPQQVELLRAHGHEVVVVTLQGFLFFGSIERVSSHIRDLIEGDAAPGTVILDFSRVSRMDASALAALRKLDILAQKRDVDVVLSDLNETLARDIARARLVEDTDRLSTAPTTDAAMEEAETALIARARPGGDVPNDALSALTALIGDGAIARRLFDEMTREEVRSGTRILTRGEMSGDVYLLERGMLSVWIRTGDDRPLRVMKQRPGAIVGEIASYAGKARTADVVADTDAVVYRLSNNKLRELQDKDPRLAAYWHQAMASGLAEKLDRTNKILGQRAS
jgi:SulP family sulfate permease